jgi:hypothetical protein
LEENSAGRRSARGSEFDGSSGRRIWLNRGDVRIDGLQEKDRESRLRVGPLSSGYGTATFMVAATGVADYKLFGF